MTQFPPNSKSNPGQTDIQEDKEKQKLTQKEPQEKLPKEPKKPVF